MEIEKAARIAHHRRLDGWRGRDAAIETYIQWAPTSEEAEKIILTMRCIRKEEARS